MVYRFCQLGVAKSQPLGLHWALKLGLVDLNLKKRHQKKCHLSLD